MRKEEELRELRKLRKPKKRYSEEEEDNIEEEKERQKMKAQLEKVLELKDTTEILKPLTMTFHLSPLEYSVLV